MKIPALAVALATAATLVVGPTATATAQDGGYALRSKVASQGDPKPAVVLRGRGWGHSTGLSQYGAYAQSREGRSHKQILAHYYPGTTLEKLSGSQRVTVRLWKGGVEEAPVEARGGSVKWHIVRDGASNSYVTQPSGATWTVRAVGGTQIELKDGSGAEVFRGAGTVEPQMTSMDTFQAAGARIYMGNPNGARREYAYGRMMFRAASGGLHISNRLPMAGYLRGLGEVPSSWGANGGKAALEAQAIIARTYTLKRGRDLCATPQCQVFVGYSKEQEAFSGHWVNAVMSTGDLTVKHGGGYAETVYSSSHGGRSEASEDSWAYGKAFPYLRSVDDPWSLTGSNKMRTWTTTASNNEFRRVAGSGLSRIERVRILSRTSGGSPKVIRVYGPEGTRDFSTTPTSRQSSRKCNRSGYAGNSLRCDLFGTVRDTHGATFAGAGGQPPSSQIRSIGFGPFTDDDSHTHEYAIVWAHLAGIAQGIDATTYAPNKPVTRGQMASFIYRTFDIPRKTSSSFRDAQSGPHAEAIASVSAAGIAKGYDKNTFGTTDPVTRAQMASFLVRALGLDPVTPQFSDVSKNGTHSGNIGALAKSGITAGCESDKYCPWDPVTRGQMATFLHRTARTQ